MKKFLFFLLIFAVGWSVYGQNSKIISGIVEEVFEDGSYIVVSGQKIITTKEFVEEAYFEIGDKVKVSVVFESDSEVPLAVDYEYDFSEESSAFDPEEEPAQEESDFELDH